MTDATYGRGPTAVYSYPDPPPAVGTGSFWNTPHDAFHRRDYANDSWIPVGHAEETADGTIPAYRLVKGHTDGTLVVGTLGSTRIVGANSENVTKVSGDTLHLAAGYVTCVAAEPLIAGARIKCADNGRITGFHESAGIDSEMASSVGSAFTNQPANDGVEILSSSAADKSVPITVIGTTYGGHTVVVETVTTNASNGTTAVSSAKTDWGVILAVKKPVTAGDITVREASGNAEIVTLLAASTSAGVVSVAAASQGTDGLAPYVDADNTTTKEVGCLYEPATGAADAYWAAALNGTTDVPITAANLVKELYVGDVEASRTVTLKTNHTADSTTTGIVIGKAISNFSAGGTGTAYISV